jgi:hypothetical protein
MSWYRSFVVGLCMSYLPRYALTTLLLRRVPESKELNFLTYFAAVWALFNICPFDLIYRFCDRPVSRAVLSIMQAHSESVVLIHNLFNIATIFTSDAIDNGKVIIYMGAILLVRPLIQWVDDVISNDPKPHMEPVSHFKRIIIFIILCNYVTQQTFLWPEPIISYYELIPVVSIMSCFFRIIDFIFYEGNPFLYIDVIFPSLGDGSRQMFW